MRALLLTLLVACGGSGGFPDAPNTTLPVPGSFAIAWSLADSGGQPLTCAQANATSVTFGVTDEATGGRFTASFGCGLALGVSGELAVATYDADFSLLGSGGVITTAPQQLGVTIQSNQTTQLTAVVFAVP